MENSMELQAILDCMASGHQNLSDSFFGMNLYINDVLKHSYLDDSINLFDIRYYKSMRSDTYKLDFVFEWDDVAATFESNGNHFKLLRNFENTLHLHRNTFNDVQLSTIGGENGARFLHFIYDSKLKAERVR